MKIAIRIILIIFVAILITIAIPNKMTRFVSSPEYFRFQTSINNQKTTSGWEAVLRGSERIFRIQIIEGNSGPFLAFEEIKEFEERRILTRTIFLSSDGKIERKSTTQKYAESYGKQGQKVWTELDEKDQKTQVQYDLKTSELKGDSASASLGTGEQSTSTSWETISPMEFEKHLQPRQKTLAANFFAEQKKLDAITSKLYVCETFAPCTGLKDELAKAETLRNEAWQKLIDSAIE